MTKYNVNGDLFEAADPGDLVDQMNAASMDPLPTRLDYLVAASARIGEQFGKEVRNKTAEAFVTDLIDLGLIKQI